MDTIQFALTFVIDTFFGIIVATRIAKFKVVFDATKASTVIINYLFDIYDEKMIAISKKNNNVIIANLDEYINTITLMVLESVNTAFGEALEQIQKSAKEPIPSAVMAKIIVETVIDRMIDGVTETIKDSTVNGSTVDGLTKKQLVLMLLAAQREFISG